jgi:hypothetical protein
MLNNWDSDVLKMDYKGQTTVFAVIFVLGGMMFLVPAITGKAQAAIKAEASTNCFAKLTYISSGGNVVNPTPEGNIVTWSTMTKFEETGGEVKYQVVGYGPVEFYFRISVIGSNTCGTKVETPTLHGGCSISHGMNPQATFYVSK